MTPTSDQPTPASSLEEAQDWRKASLEVRQARDRVFDHFHEYFNGSAGDPLPTVLALEAAARAEVIREVEAYWRAYDERLQSPAAWDRLRTAEARLRALSQGGEGKRD